MLGRFAPVDNQAFDVPPPCTTFYVWVNESLAVSFLEVSDDGGRQHTKLINLGFYGCVKQLQTRRGVLQGKAGSQYWELWWHTNWETAR